MERENTRSPVFAASPIEGNIGRPFQAAADLKSLSGEATAEVMLFGESPELPLPLPSYANLPQLWQGEVRRETYCASLQLALNAVILPGLVCNFAVHGGMDVFMCCIKYPPNRMCVQLLRSGKSTCHVTMHTLHSSSNREYHAAKIALEATLSMDFVCRIPISCLLDRCVPLFSWFMDTQATHSTTVRRVSSITVCLFCPT